MALIVVIEESPLMRPAVRDLLQLEGHTVLTSGNVQGALSLLEGIFGVDLVIANMGMPEMDGAALVERVRSTTGYQAVPILMWAFDEDCQAAQRVVDAGANDCLVRPFTVAGLTGAVRRMLSVSETA